MSEDFIKGEIIVPVLKAYIIHAMYTSLVSLFLLKYLWNAVGTFILEYVEVADLDWPWHVGIAPAAVEEASSGQGEEETYGEHEII